jgi:hypothetical protein
MLLEISNDLGKAEYTHGKRHEIESVKKLSDSEGKALSAGIHVSPDEAPEHPDENHTQAFEQ